MTASDPSPIPIEGCIECGTPANSSNTAPTMDDEANTTNSLKMKAKRTSCAWQRRKRSEIGLRLDGGVPSL